MRKTTKKKIAPVIITAGVLLYMVPLIGISLLAMGGLAGEGESGVTLILLTYAVLGGAVAIGIVKALLQRLDEIDGGEEEEASQY
jgi:positive regulator of sigma E activity